MLIQRLSNHTVNQFSRFTGERVPAASGQLFYAVAQVVGVISAPACNPHSHDWPRVFVYARSCAPGVTDLCIWIYGAAIRIAERCTTAARATEMGEQGGDKKTKNNKVRERGKEISNQILEQIQKDPKITVIDLAAATKTTEKTIRYYINKLRKGGIITRQGSNKFGTWKVIK